MQGKYRLFPKVRLSDIVYARSRKEGDLHWHNKIKGYHVDFVICEPTTTRPLLAVELDDRSHRSAKQANRDAFKDRVLTAARIPILRVQAAEAYDPAALDEEIERLVRQSRPQDWPQRPN